MDIISIETIVILTVAGVFTSMLSAICGMGGGVTLLGVMNTMLAHGILIPIHGCIQFISNLSRTLFLIKDVHRKILFMFLLGAPLGALSAFLVIKNIENKTPFQIAIIALILYTIFKPKKLPPLKIPIWSFSIVGFMAGLLGPLMGATGPMMAVFFIRDDLNKNQIIATKAATQFLVHLFKFPVFLHLGFKYFEYWRLLLPMLIATIIGTKLGVFLLDKVSEQLFIKIFKGALFLVCIRLIYKLI